MTDFKVQGLDQLLDKLSVLPNRIQRNVVTGGVRAGARVIANQAKENASRFDDPATPSNISKNIAVQSSRRLARANDGVAMRIGVRGGARDMFKHGEFKGSGKENPGGDTFYWRFLEFGTVKMSARPFMRPAMNSKAQDAFNAAAEYIDRRIGLEVAKL